MSIGPLGSILRPSARATVQAAAELVARRTAAAPPLVLWQGLEESEAGYRARIAAERARCDRRQAIIAACLPNASPLPVGVMPCEFPEKLFRLLHPSQATRYRVAYGGRGGAKSWSFIRALVLRALERPVRVLCFREIQASISESVHRLIADTITTLRLDPWFAVQQTSITSAVGAEFIFTGVRNNPAKVKSTEGVDVAFGEEAHGVSEYSWQVLIPTIRKPGSEIWVSFNPDAETDPTYQRFVKSPPPNALTECVSFRDNPWLPRELAEEERYLASVDPDAHAWVWLGHPRTASDAQVFKGKYVSEPFTPEPGWAGPYLGADWGFAQDPSALIRLWTHNRTLYVDHEVWGLGVDIDRLPALFDQVPDARRYTIRADSSRPETISYLRQHGYSLIRPALKWAGSIEDGIAHIRQYERMVVHPRCARLLEELRLYSYKIDRLTGDVLPEVVDRHNHLIDAMRYALQPLISSRNGMGFLEFIRTEMESRQTEQAP